MPGSEKLLAEGVIKAAPNRDGTWTIRIGRATSEKRLTLTRNESAELVRVLTRNVVTAAEVAP